MFHSGAAAKGTEWIEDRLLARILLHVRNKVSRGEFTAAFMLQCLEAIGCRSLALD